MPPLAEDSFMEQPHASTGFGGSRPHVDSPAFLTATSQGAGR